MKKVFSMIAFIVVLLSTVSAHTEMDFNVTEGMKVPHFEVKGANGSIVSPSDMKGRFVIVNFWSSTDADSRLAANLYNSYVDALSTNNLNLVSINIDANKSLIREIIRRDGLNLDSQYRIPSGESQNVIRRNNLDHGINSYLVDPDGRIVAINPTLSTLREAMK